MQLQSWLLIAILATPILAIGCLDLCSTNSDCGTPGFFGTCESCVNYGSGGKCMTNGTCGDSCSSDQDCYGQYGFTETCAYCIEGVCSGLQECGGPCESADDCIGYSYSSSSCKECVNNRCSNGCSDPCETDLDCGSYPCLTCNVANSTCQEYQSCGGPCNSDIACDPNSACTTCQEGFCTEPAACGANCTTSSECGVIGCPDCYEGVCGYYANCSYHMENATSCFDIEDYCNFDYCECSVAINDNTTRSTAFCYHGSSNGTVTEEMALLFPSLSPGTEYHRFRRNEHGLFVPVEDSDAKVSHSLENGALVTETIRDGQYLKKVGPRRPNPLPYHEQLAQLIHSSETVKEEIGSVGKRTEP